MRVILAGGGSGGPITPLVAVAEAIKTELPGSEFMLVGSGDGLAKQFAQNSGFSFATLPTAKWRRYFSLRNMLTPVMLFAAILKAFFLVRRFKPDVIFGAGGYTAVPMALAGFMLRKKIAIHQQDVLPSLSNKIIAPFADLITVTFANSLKDFYPQSGLLYSNAKNEKIVFTGNPFRKNLVLAAGTDLSQLRKKYSLNNDFPVVLVLGGATGAMALNKLLQAALPELGKYVQILHAAGKGKVLKAAAGLPHYHPYEFFVNIGEVYALADIVIARAGLSTITELCALKKTAIIVPMPDSHQEANALLLARHRAAVCVLEKDITAAGLVQLLRKLIINIELQEALRSNITRIMPLDADKKIANLIIKLCPKEK